MSLEQDLRELYRYEVDTTRPVGKGGCGAVWRATDRLFDRPMAIKTISDDSGLLGDERARRAFRLEAVAGARLGEISRYVIKVLDFGRISSTLFFSMEWIEPNETGRVDISDLMARMSMSQARRVLLHVGSAVTTAHMHGIVHSDIAPWNIIYDAPSDSYKLADFGLLKIVETLLVDLPSGSLLRGGRLAFLPPYARTNISLVSKASDVYALAVTLWCLIAGREVLERTDDSCPAVIRVKQTQRDAPYEMIRLINRYVTCHTEHDSIDEFMMALGDIPTR